MKSSSLLVVVVALMLALVLVSGPWGVDAVTCDIKELQPCLAAVIAPVPVEPTKECCGKLNEQQPCLCGYMKDPRYTQYWSSQAAHRICQSCGVPFPQC